MVPRHAVRQQLRVQMLEQLIRPRRGMIHLAASTQNAVLEFRRVLPDIVGHPRRVRPALRTERPCELRRHLGHLAKMVAHKLDAPVLGYMGDESPQTFLHVVPTIHTNLLRLMKR